jgi:hypothetical protein
VTTCAFAPCEDSAACGLVGGCVRERFGEAPVRVAQTLREAEGLKASAPALAGTKARAGRDPKWVKRKRKVITR